MRCRSMRRSLFAGAFVDAVQSRLAQRQLVSLLIRLVVCVGLAIHGYDTLSTRFENTQTDCSPGGTASAANTAGFADMAAGTGLFVTAVYPMYLTPARALGARLRTPSGYVQPRGDGHRRAPAGAGGPWPVFLLVRCGARRGGRFPRRDVLRRRVPSADRQRRSCGGRFRLVRPGLHGRAGRHGGLRIPTLRSGARGAPGSLAGDAPAGLGGCGGGARRRRDLRLARALAGIAGETAWNRYLAVARQLAALDGDDAYEDAWFARNREGRFSPPGRHAGRGAQASAPVGSPTPGRPASISTCSANTNGTRRTRSISARSARRC